MTSRNVRALSSFRRPSVLQLDPQMIEVAGRLRRQPQVAMTVRQLPTRRTHFAYLTMQQLGVPVASLPMSVVTMRQTPLVSGQVAFAFRNRGRADLVSNLRLLRRGALSVSMVSTPPIRHWKRV